MFRTHQFFSTSFVMIVLGYTAAAAVPGEVVEFKNLQPFTHIAYIPVGADLSSIRVEGVKAVKVATERRSVTNLRYCEQSYAAEPGGSMYCPEASNESYVPAYQVTYSYRGQPIASDEYGNTYFTFSVYFRPDELSPGLHRALSSGKMSRSAASEFFPLTISRDWIPQVVVDQENSIFCDGYYLDGNRTRASPNCLESTAYKIVMSASPYVTVKVDVATAPFETAAKR
jgi:hypothetical protein